MFTRIAPALFLSLTACLWTASAPAEVVKYLRFQAGDTVAYGIVEGQVVRKLDGDLFGKWQKTNQTFALKSVKILAPTQPRHVLAMAGNYKSHLGGRAGVTTTTITTTTTVRVDKAKNETTTTTDTKESVRVEGVVPKKFQIPQPFFKAASCVTGHGQDIVIPEGAENVHYEAELVVVISKTAKNISKDQALDYVLGVTCGNDVSARIWQKADVQWWRAKGSDTFGPCGPYIVSGLDYDDLMMQLRVNGEVKQKESTAQLIHSVADCVSFISQHVTLQPGDLIFTGTPGKTGAIQPGDVVEVELDGVGVLRNTVTAE